MREISGGVAERRTIAPLGVRIGKGELAALDVFSLRKPQPDVKTDHLAVFPATGRRTRFLEVAIT